MNLFATIAGWFRQQQPRRKMKQLDPIVAICVGHSRLGDSGAVSVGQVSEWTYNKEVADKLERELADLGIGAEIIAHYPRQTYGSAMSWLCDYIEQRGHKLAVELHFNSAGPDAHGYEYLFADQSGRSMKLAKCFMGAHGDHFPDARNRGAKGVQRAGRGAGFLWGTPCPASILEPFFGSNRSEWKAYKHQTDRLAKCYAAAISDYLTN
jgi:N-acetylmuramoyl-L-alanine amidase